MREGLARDIIRHLQGLRKDAGLELTDRITLRIGGDELLTSVCDEHAETIKAETAFTKRWTGNAWAAILGVLSLGLCHTFWQHASIAETYTLWCLLFSMELLLLRT